MNVARFEKRLIAYLIDMMLAIAVVVTGVVFAYIYLEPIRNLSWYFAIVIALAMIWFVYTFFNSVYLTISNGRTIGGLITGLKVVHPNLEKLTFKDALCRSSTIAIVPMVIANAIYMLVVHTEKTAFDRLSKTVVVDWRNRLR